MLSATGDVWLWEEDRAIPREVLLEQVADAEGLYSMLTDTVDAHLLDRAPRLKVVSNMAVGLDNVDVDACHERGIAVGHTPDVLTETTADMAFALLLAASRRVVEGVDYVRAGEWQRWEPELLWGRDVHSSTVGIVGLGRIGAAIARRARGFGMTVLYTARYRHPRLEQEVSAEFAPLPELLTRSDHVVVAVPLNDETHHLISTAEFAAMRPTATIVNISRGPVVDTDALVVALSEGQIFAAGLDVTDPEPLPADHPLMALPNCVIVPHLGSSSQRTRAAMGELAAENLLAGLAGTPLPAGV
jgi:lactate dehydrogenase-like 2-hydroxyacid dehydrogenase